MKSLRAQNKASNAARLSRVVGRATGGKVDDGDADDKPVFKTKKRSIELQAIEGKAAKPRLDRPGRRIKRDVGGGVGTWTGEGDSGRSWKELSARAQGLSSRAADASAQQRYGSTPDIAAADSLAARSLQLNRNAGDFYRAGETAEGRKRGGRAVTRKSRQKMR